MKSARIVPTLVLVALLAPSAPLPAQGGDTPDDVPGPTPTSRVAALCEAWTAARYLHPSLAYRDVDWDGAFAEASATAWNAPADARDGYRAAAEGMLAALDDPATELTAQDDEPAAEEDAGENAPSGEPAPLFRWLEEPLEGGPDEERARGVLLVDVAGYVREAGAYGIYGLLYSQAATELAKARAVIVDLRHDGGLPYQDWVNGQLDTHLGGHVSREAVGATERWLVHWGYRADSGAVGSGGYRSAFASSLAPVYAPADPEAPAMPFVFLVDESTDLPDSVLAFRAAGNGYLVSSGPPPEGLGARRLPVDLGEGLTAWVRVVEKVPPAGADLEPDAVVEPSTPEGDPARDPVMAAALALIESTPDSSPASAGEIVSAPSLRWRPGEAYPEMTAPALGYRLLAACRAWGVIRHFYPYLHLLDDWDGAFRTGLPEFAAAEGEEAYARAILRLMAHVEDGHTNVWGHPGVAAVRGAAFPPIQVRDVEGRIVVTRVLDPDLEGIEVGDEVTAVDGTPIEERIEALRPVATGSRELTRRLAAARWGLAGPTESTAVLTLRGADGETREAEVARGGQARAVEEPEEAPWRLLDPAEHDTGGLAIGYVDLTELQVPQVEPMIEALRSADAIVFDLRGYPNGTAWPLAPYLNVNGATEWASFRRREVSHSTFGSETPTGFFFIQAIPQGGMEPYRGKTVMLIDERAISQSEHTAMMFQETAGTVMVGTPTAGANGDVTNFVLPGGVHVLFTGHDVRHADDSQLQQVGILPDVEVAPTVEGIRAGRDEVLERALEHLRTELGNSSP